MALSKSDRDVLAAQLGEEVEQFLEDFTQDWQIAAESATANANDPQDDDSNVYWVVAFAGNMLWAITAFFPPGEKALKALDTTWKRATQVVSLAGAAAGSNLLGQFGAIGTGHWSLAGMKAQLSKQFAKLRGPIKGIYVQGAQQWAQNVLLDHAFKKAGFRPEDNTATRDSASIAILGAPQRDERREFTWSNYLFPNDVAYHRDGHTRSAILGEYMQREVDEALNDFNRQWTAYQNTNRWAGRARRPAFKPVLRFGGVPEAIQGKMKNYLDQKKPTPQERWNALLQQMGIKGAPALINFQ